MNTLRILIYTDMLGLDDSRNDFSVTDMCRFIRLNLSHEFDVKIDLRVRHFDYANNVPCHGATKLCLGLLKQYDELWVIGIETKENSIENPDFLLTGEEVESLKEWMKTGGVMVTGDHSQSDDTDDCKKQSDHSQFRSRGYSLGVRLPRAGQMRVWKGPPTNCNDLQPITSFADETYNTNEPGECSNNLNEECLEKDDRPQILEPMPDHFLLFYHLDECQQRIQIKHFPDHRHEGRALVPATLDDSWPAGSPPPEVVARGRDKRFPMEDRLYALLVAYDGDKAGVGRIVADSSFHHFLNLNLRGLPKRNLLGNPKPGTPLDEIAVFYANLACWLAPKALRERNRNELFLRAARHINVLEAVGNGTLTLGRAAKAALNSQLGADNLARIIEAVGDTQDWPSWGGLVNYIFTGRGDHDELKRIEPEYLLGFVIEAYYKFFRESGRDLLMTTEDIVPREVVLGGLMNAFREHTSLAEWFAGTFGVKESGRPGDGLQVEQREESGMKEKEQSNARLAMFPPGGIWHSSLKIGTKQTPEGDFDLTINGVGNISGGHKPPIPGGAFNPILGGQFEPLPSSGGKHRINLVRDDAAAIYVYTGVVTDNGTAGFEAKGRRVTITKWPFPLKEKTSKEGRKRVDGDDEWVATHPVTLELSAKGHSVGAGKESASRKASKGSSSRK